MDVIVEGDETAYSRIHQRVIEDNRHYFQELGWLDGIETIRITNDFYEDKVVSGQYNHYEGEVLLCRDVPPWSTYGGYEQQLSTLVHELAHHLHFTKIYGEPSRFRNESHWEEMYREMSGNYNDFISGPVAHAAEWFDNRVRSNAHEFVAYVFEENAVNGYEPSPLVMEKYNEFGGPELPGQVF